MFKPSEDKSHATHELIKEIFKEKVNDYNKYTLAYAYNMKTGLLSKKISSYAIGFSLEDSELVVIPMDSDGNSGDPIVLPADSITSAKMDMQGGAKIKSDLLDGELRFTVPPYTPKALEEAYILPVIQEEVAAQFKSFIKEL